MEPEQTTPPSPPVTVSQIMAARKALSGYVYETPMILSNALSARTGHEQVLLKCENLQRTGSYHLRGHMYKVLRTIESSLDVDNFVTFSTANGGAALSCAATAFQTKARVAVPKNLTPLIARSIKHYGGECFECDPVPEARKNKVAELMDVYNRKEGKVQHHAVYVAPYTDPLVITGYGTVGVELMLQSDCSVDCVIVPVGGGSLLAGIATAVKAMKPNVGVYGVQPTHSRVGDPYVYFKRGDTTHEGDDKYEAPHTPSGAEAELAAADAAMSNAPAPPRVVKGDALHQLIAERHRNIPARYVDGFISVNTPEVRYAFRYLYERCKLVVDTKAAMAVAAVLARPPELQKYRKVALVLTGGNIDLSEVSKIAAPKL